MTDETLPSLLRRKRSNLRKKEIAARLNIPLGTYIKYERGERHPSDLARAELLRRLSEL